MRRSRRSVRPLQSSSGGWLPPAPWILVQESPILLASKNKKGRSSAAWEPIGLEFDYTGIVPLPLRCVGHRQQQHIQQGKQRESAGVDQESPWGKRLISPLVYRFTEVVQSLKSPPEDRSMGISTIAGSRAVPVPNSTARLDFAAPLSSSNVGRSHSPVGLQ